MNRDQAEHILDAYVAMEVDLHFEEMFSQETIDAVREIILDAMTEYRSKPTTWPGITLPSTSYPTNWDGSPKVTCTGIDPAFGTNTAVVEGLGDSTNLG